MKLAITSLVATLALASCGLPLPDGATLNTTLGWYSPALPGDQDAKFGAFTERVAPATVEAEK